VDRLLQKIDAMGSADRKYGSGRKCMPARVGTLMLLKSLFLSQEDTPAPEIHRTVRH